MSDNLPKDESILRFLNAIELKSRGWIIVDHWPADRFAIGIARNNETEKLGYISTWRKPPGHYYVELEGPAIPGSLDSMTEAKVDDCDLPQAISLLEKHLGGHKE